MASSDSQVIEGIMTQFEIDQASKRLSHTRIEVPKELETKRRWLQITIYNETQFEMEYQESYFCTGQFFNDLPASRIIQPFSKVILYVCNRKPFMTGVAGSFTFKLNVPQNGEEQPATTICDVSIGFANPYKGPPKVSVMESDDPIDAYKKSTSNGNLFMSDIIQGKLMESDIPTGFQIHGCALPKQCRPVITIWQVVHSFDS